MAHITILGFGVGGLTATVPMWVSECTQARNRGIMVMLSGWFAVGGLVLATWLEFGLYFVPNNSVSWRLPIAFQAVFALIIVSTVLFMPESPRWLIKMDRVEEARGILATLDDIPQESQEMAENLAMIQYTLTEEMRLHDSASPFALTHNRHLHRTLLAMGVNFFAQMSGISVITFYSTTIFESDLGYSGTVARIISGSLQIWQFCCAGVAVLLIDRLGRRPLLIATASAMCIAQFCLAGLSSDISNHKAGSATVFFYFFVETFFPMGFLLVPFMYAAEVAPLRTRAKVTALSAATNWIFR
jgi:MFS family permease